MSEPPLPRSFRKYRLLSFLICVYLFGVTAEKRGDGGGMNVAREGVDDNLCFILRLCRANGAAAPMSPPLPL